MELQKQTFLSTSAENAFSKVFKFVWGVELESPVVAALLSPPSPPLPVSAAGLPP